MNNICNNSFCYDQKGFTIIEVMVAVAILAVGILGIATMQMSAIRGNNLSDNITCALALAEDKMEGLLGLDYNDPELADNVPGNNSDLSRINEDWIDNQELDIDETGKPGSGQFRRIWNIADNEPIDKNKTIKVIVLWNNNKHQVSLTSIKRS